MAPKPFESWIQDLVYNVDVGIGLRLIKVLLYIIFVFGLLLIYTAAEFRGLKDAEAMEYAQLGRQFARTGSLTTQCIRPLSMWYLLNRAGRPSAQIDNHPDLMHPPVYPAVLAGVFKLFNPSYDVKGGPGGFICPADRWVAGVGHLFTVLTGLLVYLMGRRLFDERVALLAVTVYFLSDAVWRHSLSGTTLPIATAWVTAALYFALRAGPDPDEPPFSARACGWMLLSLVFCALAFHTRYATAVVVPGIALHLALARRPNGWIAGVVFVALFLLSAAPWLARNVMVSGSPLALAPYSALNHTSLFDGDNLEHQFQFTLSASTVFSSLQAKALANSARFFFTDLPSVGGGLLGAFFLVTFFYRFSRDDVRGFRWGLALAILLFAGVASYFGEATRPLLHMFLPAILLYGGAFFFLLLDRLQFPYRILNIAVTGVVVVWSASTLIVTLLPPRAAPPYPPYFPPFVQQVSRMLGPQELMCSDMPWATAWYGQRNSLLVPLSLDEFYEINDFHKHISGLYFTTITRDKPYIRSLATGPYRTWFPILETRIPGDFPLKDGFSLPRGSADQLFLTDRIRWGP
jgi:hypothetical protein